MEVLLICIYVLAVCACLDDAVDLYVSRFAFHDDMLYAFGCLFGSLLIALTLMPAWKGVFSGRR